MFNSLDRQETDAHLPINTPTQNNQKTPRFTRVLSALFPFFSNRLGQPSVITHQADMRNSGSMAGLESLSVIESSPMDTLLSWQNNTPDNELQGRRVAARRILHCMNHREDYLDLSGLELTSLPNNIFQHIKSLRMLNCSFNQLMNLDLNDCAKITTLDCNHNQLETLDLRHCSGLIELSCSFNQLVNLDLSHCVRLRYLNARDNPALRDCVFPQINLQRANNLRDLGLQNTNIQWNHLPEETRENQDIYIDIRPHYAINQNLNNAQNTHTESIHRSASRNAAKLKRDNSEVDISRAYRDLSKWILRLPIKNSAIENGTANEAFKNKAAQEWIRHPVHLKYVDKSSKISVKEFLALAWIAIHDETQRELGALLHNAKESLRDALYEVRRGYNLGQDLNHPTDDGEAASNICAGGTFNKVSEKLVSVVKDISFQLITQETFTTSLRAIIRREVVKLTENADYDRSQRKALDDNDGLLTESIWNQIKQRVKTAIDAEFESEDEIGGLSIDALFNQNTDFDNVLAFLKVLPD